MEPMPGFVVVPGLVPEIEAAGIHIVASSDGNGDLLWHSSEPDRARAIAASFNPIHWMASNSIGTGALDELQAQTAKMLDWVSVAESGSADVTGPQVATYIAAVINNHRKLKAAIILAHKGNSHSGLAEAHVVVKTGWPVNP